MKTIYNTIDAAPKSLNKGFMSMVGHIAEASQIVSCDFPTGNTPPNKNNLEFIQQCEQALPAGCYVKALGIDVAGYILSH